MLQPRSLSIEAYPKANPELIEQDRFSVPEGGIDPA
jgi:hypothetical protein